MRPNISEFSYGFAITSELIQSPDMTITAAPVFPSLIQEGQAGGGWDMQLTRPGLPLFLQFKLCDYMKRRTCKESTDAGFSLPCYRMHLRSARLSDQHAMLLELEATGQEVYYSAPLFHQPQELNSAFLGRTMRMQSKWVRPSDIGPLPDEGEHFVSFEPRGRWELFSKPRPLAAKREFQDVVVHLEAELRKRGSTSLRRDELNSLAESIEMIAQKRRDIGYEAKHRASEVLRGVEPLQKVSYYASVFLESQMFVVQARSEQSL